MTACSIDAVVARAGELHELQLGRRAEELVADPEARRPEIVLGVRRRIVEPGRGGVGDDQLHAGREQFAGDLHDGSRLLGREDLDHDSPPEGQR